MTHAATKDNLARPRPMFKRARRPAYSMFFAVRRSRRSYRHQPATGKIVRRLRRFPQIPERGEKHRSLFVPFLPICVNLRNLRTILLFREAPMKMESAARTVAARLQGAGFTAYFAGGCVRDQLRGIAPHDFDIATNARPEQVQALFPRTVAVGAHFGVDPGDGRPVSVRGRQLPRGRCLHRRPPPRGCDLHHSPGRRRTPRFHHQRHVPRPRFRRGHRLRRRPGRPRKRWGPARHRRPRRAFRRGPLAPPARRPLRRRAWASRSNPPPGPPSAPNPRKSPPSAPNASRTNSSKSSSPRRACAASTCSTPAASCAPVLPELDRLQRLRPTPAMAPRGRRVRPHAPDAFPPPRNGQRAPRFLRPAARHRQTPHRASWTPTAASASTPTNASART